MPGCYHGPALIGPNTLKFKRVVGSRARQAGRARPASGAPPCAASRAMIAASRMGIFREYFLAHFGSFERIKRAFSPDVAIAAAAGLADAEEFTETMNSRETEESLARDLELARRLGIRATPTIIIGGRRLEGVPPAEILFGIIDREFRSDGGAGAKRR